MQPYNPDHDAMVSQTEDDSHGDDIGFAFFDMDIDAATSRYTREMNKPKCMPDKAFKAWVKFKQKGQPTVATHSVTSTYWKPDDYDYDEEDRIDHFECW